jgi:hypothetical protein
MDYLNRGALFTSSQRKSEKAPEFFGSIKLDRAYIKDLLSKTDEDGIEVKLSGWKKPTKTGGTFLSLAVDTFVKTGAAPSAPKVPSEERDPWA